MFLRWTPISCLLFIIMVPHLIHTCSFCSLNVLSKTSIVIFNKYVYLILILFLTFVSDIFTTLKRTEAVLRGFWSRYFFLLRSVLGNGLLFHDSHSQWLQMTAYHTSVAITEVALTCIAVVKSWLQTSMSRNSLIIGNVHAFQLATMSFNPTKM